MEWNKPQWEVGCLSQDQQENLTLQGEGYRTMCAVPENSFVNRRDSESGGKARLEAERTNKGGQLM